jgi:hypothetical protein
MHIKLSRWIYKSSNGWVVLATLLIMILFMIIVLPRQAEKSQDYAEFSPDTSFFYLPQELITAADLYGSDGRQAYISQRWTFDLIFPLVYVGFLTSGISWFLKDKENGSFQVLNLLPIIAGGFDYLENIATTAVMAMYPTEFYIGAYLASGFTLVKWILVYGSFGVYFITFFMYLAPLIKSMKN